MSLRKILPAALAALALAPAGAQASSQQESMFQDDPLLVYGTPEQQFQTVERLAQLGVDRLRISMFWRLVAPNADGQPRPAGFDATDHVAYGPAAWERYDQIVRAGQRFGVQINFNVTAPGPEWAMGDPGDRPDLKRVWRPDPKEFGDFVQAVGTRYSGMVPGIPRVSYWSVWNEPNQGAWLAPQSTVPAGGDGTRMVETSAQLYRGLANSAVSALTASGHGLGTDTILIGETAPKGSADRGPSRPMSPRRFILRMYCLDDNAQFLRGAAAEELGCPTGPDPGADMRTSFPGLFGVSGYAHHPYELAFQPTRRARDRESFTLANVRELGSLLERIFARSAVALPSNAKRFPLYLTEYGYQTNPPDPLGVTNARQAAYINEAEYLTMRNPAIKTLGQFLLVDDGPDQGAFQSGLKTMQGKTKPSYAAYRLPLFVRQARVRRGSSVSLWGMARGGRNGTRQSVVVERRLGAMGKWRKLRSVRTEPRRGYFSAKVKLSRTGAVRLAWRDTATKRTHRSRTIPITILAKRR